MDDEEEVVVIELGDTLDLHHFRPGDIKELIPDFLDDAAAKGYPEVRIIHGKGTGALRRGVHAILERGGASYLFYHVYDANDAGRTTLRIAEMVWDDEGWPVAGGP